MKSYKAYHHFSVKDYGLMMEYSSQMSASCPLIVCTPIMNENHFR